MSKVFDYNQDGVTDFNDIYALITDLMKLESKKKIMNKQKKQNVMDILKNTLPVEVYDRFHSLLSSAIDWIYTIAQNPKMLKDLKEKCLLFPCCK
jgi:hypothetical protein